MAKNTAPQETVKSKSVAGTIPADLHAALEDHRWDARLTMSQLVSVALGEYAQNHAVEVKSSGE